MSKFVTGVFRSRMAAETAVEELATHDIDRADIDPELTHGLVHRLVDPNVAHPRNQVLAGFQ